jgi:hypothetical protein
LQLKTELNPNSDDPMEQEDANENDKTLFHQFENQMSDLKSQIENSRIDCSTNQMSDLKSQIENSRNDYSNTKPSTDDPLSTTDDTISKSKCYKNDNITKSKYYKNDNITKSKCYKNLYIEESNQESSIMKTEETPFIDPLDIKKSKPNTQTENEQWLKKLLKMEEDIKSNEVYAVKTKILTDQVKSPFDKIKKKPYQCKECPKAYGRHYHLKEHVDIAHRMLKPFQCEICLKMFGMRSNLKSHINFVHYNLRPYDCKMCPKEFRTSNSLKGHVTHVHNKVKQEV